MGQTDPAPKEPPKAAQPAKKRAYLKQSDVPEFGLEEAIRAARVIVEQYGRQPTTPADVALALGILPKGRHFEGLTGSSIAYGLTEGGAQAETISVTPLGLRAVAPLEEGDDVTAMREALLHPRVPREFLERSNGSALPTDERIARNVLESLGVPASRTEATLAMIVGTAESLGLLGEARGKKVVNLRPASRQLTVVVPAPDEAPDEEVEPEPAGLLLSEEPPETPAIVTALPEPKNRHVFITHGSNRKIVEQLKKLLEYGEFEPIVSEERETTAKPVPQKVFDEMGFCGAGVIHVAKEQTIIDQDGKEHRLLNENVLIEIGAAMALWGDNFILLVEQGTQLPSNLQGLYEVRYEGTTLDADATMKLLHAFKQFKS